MDLASLRDFRASSFGTPSNNASWGTPYCEAERTTVAVPEIHGSAMQSIALAGEIDVGANVSLAGWAQVSAAAYFTYFILFYISRVEEGFVSDYVYNRSMYPPCDLF